MTKTKKYHIAFVLVSMESGGTENYLLRFLSTLANDVEATIICKGGKTGTLENNYRKLGIKIKILKLGYLNLKNIITFKRLLKDYDAVCDLTGNFAGISMFLANLNGIPKRVSFYRASSNHFTPNFLNNTYNGLMNKLVYHFSTDILSNSRAAFDYFYPIKSKKDSRFKIIRNGVDINLFSKKLEKNQLRKKYGLPEDCYLIGHVGRWNAAKNFPTIFKVAETLLSIKNGLNIAFVFCGRETDSINFKTHLINHGISDHCFPLGEQTKVYEVLNCLDLFYFPSITEGQPNALIEAIISGLPFVASNIEAIKESLPQEAHAQLVHPLNIEQTVFKIKEIMKNEKAFIHSDWAKKEYRAEDRFAEFKHVLLSN